MDERFKKIEEEYFRLKGQLAAGRIDQAQFEAALKELMIQDARGRYWMLGVNNAKWHVHDGVSWVEAEPEDSAAQSESPAKTPMIPASVTTSKSTGIGWLVVFAAAAIAVFVVVFGFFILAVNRGNVQISLGPSATPTANAEATRTAEAQASHATETAIASKIIATQTAAAPTVTSTPTATALPTMTSTRTATPIPPTPTATPRPTGNCADPGAQLSFQDGYRPDPYFHILGTATAQNFQFYLMEFADRTDNPQWRQLRDPVIARVENDELALWVLSTVGGHQWYIRVTVYLNDGTTLAPCVRWIQQR